jgi:DNA primase
VTTAWWKEERGERIFVDFNQANRDRTMAGAYSPRALPGATVSTPVHWEELDGLDPATFTVRSIPQRLDDVGDPWAGAQQR